MSAASDVFFGDIEQHKPESMAFRKFLSLARDGSGGDGGASASDGSSPVSAVATAWANGGGHEQQAERDAAGHAAGHSQPPGSSSRAGGRRYYLAQAGIGSRRQGGAGDGEASAADSRAVADDCGAVDRSSSLAALAADFAPPPLLRDLDGGQLQTNLWMSIRCVSM